MLKKYFLSLILFGFLPIRNHCMSENSAGKAAMLAVVGVAAYQGAKKAYSLYKKQTLLMACKKGALEKVQQLIQAGVDMNARDKKGRTPLHLAVKNNLTDVVKLLIEAGAEVNALDKDFSTPLHLAAFSNAEIVEMLIQAGADPSAKGCNLKTPFECALIEGVVDDVTMGLLYKDSGYSLDLGLYWACFYMNEARAVKILIQLGADPNYYKAFNYDSSFSNPLNPAIRKGNSEIVKLLIQAGAEVNVKSIHDWTPLHLAAKKGNIKILNLLLSRFNLPKAETSTTTFFNIESNQEEVWDLKSLALKTLIDNIEGYDEKTYAYIVGMLIENPSILNQCKKILPYIDLHNNHHRKFLSLVAQECLADFCEQKHLENLRDLISAMNVTHSTPLDVAEFNNNIPCVELLKTIINAENFNQLPEEIKEITFGTNI